jgi:hypothetical protein
MRLAILAGALGCATTAVDLMSRELGWSDEEKRIRSKRFGELEQSTPYLRVSSLTVRGASALPAERSSTVGLLTPPRWGY